MARLIDKVPGIPDLKEIWIVTNNKFEKHFKDWAVKQNEKHKIRVFNDGTLTNETRLGAIGDMDYVLKKSGSNDDLLVIGGDNLFEFDMKDFVRFAGNKGISMAARRLENIEDIRRFGEVKVDKGSKLVSMREKPEKPESALAASCVYYFPGDSLKMIEEYLSEGNNPDQPGRYIAWLYKRVPVYIYQFTENWYDIGDKKQYRLADEEYQRIEKKK